MMTTDQEALHDELFGAVDLEVSAPALVRDGHLAPYQELAYFTTPTPAEADYIRGEAVRFAELRAGLLDPGFAAPRSWTGCSAGSWSAAGRRRRAGLLGAVRAGRARRWPTRRCGCTATACSRCPRGRGCASSTGARRPPRTGWRSSATTAATACSPVVTRVTSGAYEAIRRGAAVDRLPAHARRPARRRVPGRPRARPLGEQGRRRRRDLARRVRRARRPGRAPSSSPTSPRRPRHGARGPVPAVMDEGAGGALLALDDAARRPSTAALDPVLMTGQRVACGPQTARRLAGRARAAPTPASAHRQPAAADGRGHGRQSRRPGWEPRRYVPLVTRFFADGGSRCLVGTRALLGEGWDAPAVNVVDRLDRGDHAHLRRAGPRPRPAAGRRLAGEGRRQLGGRLPHRRPPERRRRLRPVRPQARPVLRAVRRRRHHLRRRARRPRPCPRWQPPDPGDLRLAERRHGDPGPGPHGQPRTMGHRRAPTPISP